MAKPKSMLKILEETSRTFYIPIVRLPPGLQEAVAAAYLSMRAVDEIEDHPGLNPQDKATILQSVSFALQGQHSIDTFKHEDLSEAFQQYPILPEVTLRLGEWATLAPGDIAPRIWEATAAMAERMAMWARRGWSVVTRTDLDRYTFSVAGAVGLLLCDLWGWFEGMQPERSVAVSFGRGLQAVNILRNRKDDLSRGVDFYPDGWGDKDIEAYARDNLSASDKYSDTFPALYKSFIAIPHALAVATLDARSAGIPKLSRTTVLQIVSQFDQA